VRNVFSVLDNSRKIRIIFLAVLGTIGFSLRLYFFPEDLPLIGDASRYFWYANDISILGHFPEGHLSVLYVQHHQIMDGQDSYHYFFL